MACACNSCNSYLIVNFPTAIFYSNQAGGLLCSHPEAQGFIIPFDGQYGFIISKFNDCELLCWMDKADCDDSDLEVKLRAAVILNDFLSKIDQVGYYSIRLEINIDDISDLTEAWWPVKGEISEDEFNEKDRVPFTGYIAKSNCC